MLEDEAARCERLSSLGCVRINTHTQSARDLTGLGTFKQVSDDARSRLKAFLQTLELAELLNSSAARV